MIVECGLLLAGGRDRIDADHPRIAQVWCPARAVAAGPRPTFGYAYKSAFELLRPPLRGPGRICSHHARLHVHRANQEGSV